MRQRARPGGRHTRHSGFAPEIRTSVAMDFANVARLDEIDLLISDVVMPVMDGPEFAKVMRELGRAGPSYTVDTLTELRAELGARPLCLLVGEDAFRGLPTWHRWQALFELAHVVVMQRPPLPGANDALPAELRELLRSRLADTALALAQAPAGLVWQQAIPPLDVSATRIRALLRAGHSARFLMTDSCLRYIRGHHLYTD